MKPSFPIRLLWLFSCFLVACSKETLPADTHQPQGPVLSQTISNLDIHAFAEDSFGQIWIGTDRGLNRYTGKEFYQYYTEQEERSSINNNMINSMAVAPDGRLWVGTASGPAWYTEEDNFHRVEVIADVGFKTASRILVLESGDVVMSNPFGTIFKYDEESDEFHKLQPLSGKDLPSSNRIFTGAGSSFWMVASDGVYQIDSQGSLLVRSFPYPTGSFFVSGSAKDKDGRIWFFNASQLYCFDSRSESYVDIPVPIREWMASSEGKVLRRVYSCGDYLVLQGENECGFYDLNDGTLVRQSDPDAPYTLPSFRPTVMFMDSGSHLWVGSQGHGFVVCSGAESLFNRNASALSSLKDVNILSLDADTSDNIWAVATENRLFRLFRSGDAFSLDTSRFIDGSSSEEMRVVLCDRTRNRVWIGTRSAVFMCEPEKDGTGLRILRKWSLGAVLTTLSLSDKGGVYAGQYAGIVSYIDPDRSGAPEQILSLSREIRDIYPLKDGRLAVLAMMEDITLYDPVSGETETIVYRESLGELFHLLDMCEDNEGNWWFTTRDYGLVKRCASDGTFKIIPGTTCPTLESVEMSDDGRIWVSSAFGLNMVIPGTEEIVRYFAEDGIGGNQFNVRASCKLSDGTVVFGGTHGLTTCHDVDISDPKPAPLYIEEFSIEGVPVSPSVNGPYSGLLQRNPKITLKHNQGNISISFASLAYSRPRAVLYQYKMEGYDRNWTFLGNDNRARFSSLPPGRYLFCVKAGSLDEEPVSTELSIRVKPALMASPGAFLVYLLILGALAFFIARSARNRLRLHMRLAQAQREKAHEQLVNKVNMNFFADMAHEFRSPLTMIQGPMSQLLEDRSMGADSHKLLSVMNHSVMRMKKLVDQLLNFNKLDNGRLTLSVVRDVDIVSRLSKVVEMSGVTAKRRGISLQTSGFDAPFKMPLDPDKFDSIISNLMSNALKYAGNNGEPGWIEVRFIPGEDNVKIQVDNDSRPFSEEELKRIFERYYQVREHAQNAMAPGTGIGLNFAWMLASRMHGSLEAENLPDRTGVRFTLTLPANDDAFSEDEFVKGTDLSPVEPLSAGGAAEELGGEHDDEDSSQETKPYTVLVVDDDVDIANYLSILLSPYYNVLMANDVEHANELLLSGEMPDLIISDVVMPGQDGISFCQSVKSNMLTCHIPVILVTAKVGVSNEVQGLDSGADAYVTKPFDPVYLLALLKSLLKNRSLLRGELAKSTSVAEVRSDLLAPRDAAFLEQLYSIMESEMANPELDLQKICDIMCVSRTKLFYKVKSLTGMSASTIFKTFRLNMAAKMLREGNDNVSEVAYKVGFNSPSYFTRAFKAQFGVLPKDIAKT